ncbi:MAG: hypothetical protein EPN88_05470 [Bacteroidetes bacterium]|nr:MAG: hypothetical protein EPN88_05470 [Bacteroidota bacterium]
MKKTILSFIIILVIIGTATRQNSFANNRFSQDHITKMLKSFYTCLATIHNLNKLDSVKRLNCTSNYFKEIENQEMLDYEPLIKAQDFGFDCLKTLTIKKDLKRADLYYVTYIEPNTKMKVTIKLIIVKEKERYKIDYVFLDKI